MFLGALIKDVVGVKNPVLDNKFHAKKTMEWLLTAQEVTKTGGVSSWFRIDKGWGEPFIETTGYIMSSFLEYSVIFEDKRAMDNAKKMADFLIDMQLKNGGFRTYVTKFEPTVFNTAQDLSGMCDIYRHTKDKKYYKSAMQAADFLVKIQNKDGSWVKYSYDGKAHSYDSKVASAIAKFYLLSNIDKYKKAAIKGLDFVLTMRTKSGWFKNAELPKFKHPHTHTIAYVYEGLLDAGVALKQKKYTNACKNGIDNIVEHYESNNFLPATFDSSWNSSDSYSCLTGNAQIAVLLSKMYLYTKNKSYLKYSKKIINEIKATQDCFTRDKNIMGGIKGSQPIYGDVLRNSGYCRFAYINWAAKYFLDSLLVVDLAVKNKKTIYV